MLLVRPNIVEVTKACRGITDKAASFYLKHTEHTFHHYRVEQNIIIKKMNVRRMALLDKKVPLFCHSPLWQVAMKHYLVTVPFERLHKRLNLNTLKVGIIIIGLIRDDYIEVSIGLA
jgi:hypothetical protein